MSSDLKTLWIMTGPFLLSILVFVLVFFVSLFFRSVRQIKLDIRQLLGARKYSYRIVSYRIVSYTISYWSSVVTMSVSCTVSETLSVIFQNLKRSRDHEHIHSAVIHDACSTRPTRKYRPAHQFWSSYNFTHSKDMIWPQNLERVTWPWPRPLRG